MATLVRRSGVRRIVLLTLGWEDLPKNVSIYGLPPEEQFRCPVPGVLLQTDGGWVLLDTGFNTALIRDPYLRRRYFPSVEYQPVLPVPVSRSRSRCPRSASTWTTSGWSRCRICTSTTPVA